MRCIYVRALEGLCNVFPHKKSVGSEYPLFVKFQVHEAFLRVVFCPSEIPAQCFFFRRLFFVELYRMLLVV